MSRVQSIKFNISMATVGRINQNGIVTFGKICHLPRGGTALICTMIKRATGAQAGRPYLIFLFQNSAPGETGTVRVSRKKLQTIKFN